MDETKVFDGVITYVKAGCWMMVGASVLGIALVKVAPFLTLEQLIFQDWYGRPTLPPEAVKPFELGYLLFAWLSVLTGITMFYTVRHGLQQRERWGYHCYVLLGVFWPVGAVGVALYTTAYWYLLSATMMAALFLPPVFILPKYLKPAS